jgi:NarL family two-component system response regulator LiaR
MIRSGRGRLTPGVATFCARSVTVGEARRNNVGTTLTAVIVDQWELVALGISAVLAEQGIDTLTTAVDARQGVRAARELRADLLVLGATAQASPVDAAHHAVRLHPRPAVITLVSGADHAELGQLIAEGVDALLVRSASSDELGEAVARIRRGERYVAPALLSSLVGAITPVLPADDEAVLTARERDVLACLAQGRTNRQIAQELFVGVETVKSHLSRLYTKLEARDRHDAVARALAAGLLG